MRKPSTRARLPSGARRERSDSGRPRTRACWIPQNLWLGARGVRTGLLPGRRVRGPQAATPHQVRMYREITPNSAVATDARESGARASLRL